jgi:glycosyltransferase involved in cell wall biosynthesis
LSAESRWAQIYNQVPLVAVPGHYAGMTGSHFLYHYLVAVLKLAPVNGRTLETGIGSGYGAVWLSLRGVQASGIDYAAAIVERARQVNQRLGGHAAFETGDLFDLYDKNAPRYDVIHHQGVLEHFTVPEIRAALAQQVACADYVVFSVPSVNYPFAPEFGNERLMPLAEWERILAPFDVEELKYYGDPKLGAEEQVLCTLRGQKVDDALLAVMHPKEPFFQPGVSAIVHTRNEAARIADCLETLNGWADQIIVCDMESEDDTIAIARRYTDEIVFHPKIENFDQSRNVSAMRAGREWVFFLDADERVPERLGRRLKEIALSRPTDFDAMLIPFRHHFAGHWMRSMYPGYTAPRLLRNGKFVFNPRLHSGAQVDGRVTAFPADDPDLALVHYSFDSLHHYLEKLNNYTDGESLNMHRDGQVFHWQNSVSHFVHDFKNYYENGHGNIDGVHGFLYAFQSAFYRFFQHGKLYERRYNNGQLTDWEKMVPASLEEMLEFALRVCREKRVEQKKPIKISEAADAANVVWTGPVLDRSGYGDESRNLVFALSFCLNETIATQALPWGKDAQISESDKKALDGMSATSALPGFTQIVHTFGSRLTLERSPDAKYAIGRTVFETDRLPKDWVEACNQMDAIWVQGEFNRKTFVDSGVDPAKIAVVPECLDAAAYRNVPTKEEVAKNEALPQSIRGIASCDGFTFLSIFDWTLHKGWDVLLRAFLTGFATERNVRLVLKVWSSNGYRDEDILQQAREFCRRELNIDIASNERIVFVK